MEYHKFEDRQKAIEAIDQINQYCGIPVSEDSVTKTYTDYFKYEDFYLILVDEITLTVLGEENIWETEDE